VTAGVLASAIPRWAAATIGRPGRTNHPHRIHDRHGDRETDRAGDELDVILPLSGPLVRTGTQPEPRRAR
jgi:hypothetical protein